ERYREKIKNQEKGLFKHPVVRGYLKQRRKATKLAMIREVQKEVKEILKTEGPEKGAKKIANRQAKILNIKAGELTAKKDRERLQFNFGSTQQLADLFYESEHGFKFPSVAKTKTGAESTGEEALLKLQKK